jgi:DNA-binding GntR family transcriptional regulator
LLGRSNGGDEPSIAPSNNDNVPFVRASQGSASLAVVGVSSSTRLMYADVYIRVRRVSFSCEDVKADMTSESKGSAELWESELRGRWELTSAARDDAGSTAEAVRQSLTAAIVNRELPPGLRLGEDRLATLFGVSRTPVREALVGLVNASLAVRDSHGFLRVGSITSEQILEVYAIRQVLEGFAASRAALVASPADLAKLKQLNSSCARAAAKGDFEALASDNLRFHSKIAASCGNRLLDHFVEEIHNWVNRIGSTTLSYPNRASVALKEHQAIIDAIEKRDSERAERLAREHMRAAEGIRIAMLVDAC